MVAIIGDNGKPMGVPIPCSTYFTYDSTIYKQVFGPSMGSSLSPIIANMVMFTFHTLSELFEKKQILIFQSQLRKLNC